MMPDIEPRLTMLPLGRAIMCRPKAREHQQTPLTLTSITARHSTSVVSSAVLSRAIPALLMRMSTLAHLAMISDATASMLSGSVTSTVQYVGSLSKDAAARSSED